MDQPSLRIGRARIAWWGILVALGVGVAAFLAAFVGTFLLGLFFYYAVRPLHRRIHRGIRHRGASASLTLLLVILPVLAVLGYAGLAAFREFAAVVGPGLTSAVLERLPADPRSVEAALRGLLSRLGSVSELRKSLAAGIGPVVTAANGLLHLTLALALTFFLLRDGSRLSGWFREDVAESGGVADAYLTAVDADLEAVYFGNVLTVLLVGGVSLVVYHGFNLLAPAPLRIPLPTLLALLTALATFVPLVVGKVVYVPVAAGLGWQALRADAAGLVSWVLAFLAVSFLALDLLPQTVVRPYVSGRSLHTGLVLFAYVLGAALFGWYGLFLGPLLLVLAVQAANVVLPELLHGERLTPATYISIGSEPWSGEASGSSPNEGGDNAGGGVPAEGDSGGADGG